MHQFHLLVLVLLSCLCSSLSCSVSSSFSVCCLKTGFETPVRSARLLLPVTAMFHGLFVSVLHVCSSLSYDLVLGHKPYLPVFNVGAPRPAGDFDSAMHEKKSHYHTVAAALNISVPGARNLRFKLCAALKTHSANIASISPDISSSASVAVSLPDGLSFSYCADVCNERKVDNIDPDIHSLRQVLANLNVEYDNDNCLPQLRPKLKSHILKLRKGKDTERIQR
ncbi:hypothetical protein DFH08DRAFT_799686 [Mycena albidolilacea]|uniref:Uncharacterized protein n=1 Tax=Mycena albidolilacea TaxID=1033008 RepID=A0AAD7F2A8_9AGAR|nr:hypothetical protein DFH08DRAFT_799686 [Mycena albidolilacea]